jgi:peptide/nickel transport system ATP-binding protein
VNAAAPVLEGRGLTKSFWVKQGRGPLARRSRVHAVEDVSVRLDAGKVTAVVGESGAGKTTVARLLAKIIRPDAGELLLDGRPAPAGRPRSYARQVQMVFQDSFASLNPVHRVRHHLIRPLQIHHIADGRLDAAVSDLLRRVALEPPDNFTGKFPHELSGGQRQRVAIARALAVRPRVLIADEPVSMLDVSIRLGVLNLLADLRDREHLAILYVTHDIASARYLADTIVVTQRQPDRQRGASLHAASARRRPRPRSGGGARPRRARRAPEPDRPSERMSLPPSLPVRHGCLQTPGAAECRRLVGSRRRVLASCRAGTTAHERKRLVDRHAAGAGPTFAGRERITGSKRKEVMSLAHVFLRFGPRRPSWPGQRVGVPRGYPAAMQAHQRACVTEVTNL